MRRLLLTLLVFASLCALAKSAQAMREPAPLEAKIARLRAETWRWERLMTVPRSHVAAATARARLEAWQRRAIRARARAAHPPHRSAWACIHRFEGAWTDPNAPYYGGLQMDVEFMRTYAPELLARKGTADHWTPLEQMWVAERAFRSGRGFTPWPNTARSCGLL